MFLLSEDWKIILVGVFGAMFLLAVLVLIFVILCIRKGKDKGEKEVCISAIF